jgi:hypothetical protein
VNRTGAWRCAASATAGGTPNAGATPPAAWCSTRAR